MPKGRDALGWRDPIGYALFPAPLRSRKRLVAVAGFVLAVCAAFAAGALLVPVQAPTVVGTFTVIKGNVQYLVAAPHGAFDVHTGTIARGVCLRTGWSCLVARGFETEGPRINVNRPTEGVRLEDTLFSTRAAEVYGAYMGSVRRVAPRLRLYVEIHGNNHPGSADHIEIATAGVSQAWAKHIQESVGRGLRNHGAADYAPRIDMVHEVRYAASHNRKFGALSMIQPALHIELPRSARLERRGPVIEALSEALPAIAALVAPQQYAAR